MKRQILWSLLAVLAVAIASCAQAPVEGESLGRQIQVEGGSYTDVSPSDLQSMLEDKDFVLVNVHIPVEGDLPETDVSFPFDEVEANLDLLPEDKDAKIVLYCRSDRMSRIAAETLIGLGFTNLWNLDGGFNAWRAAGLPFEGVE